MASPLRPLREGLTSLMDALLFPFLRSRRDSISLPEWRNTLQVRELESWEGERTRHNNFMNLAESIRLLGLDKEKTLGPRVLDVGAGPRSVAYYVGGKKAKWVALDPLAPDYARKKLLEKSPADYVSGVAEKLPFKDASLNAIVCINSMDHMINPAASVQEFQRALKKGGRVYLSVELFNHFLSRNRWYNDCHPYDFSKAFVDGLFENDFKVERKQVHREGTRQQLNAVYAKK